MRVNFNTDDVYKIYKINEENDVSECLGYISVLDPLFEVYLDLFEKGSVLLVPAEDL